MSERTFAATTGSLNAGTVSVSVLTYWLLLPTSLPVPPVLAQVRPLSSGSGSVGGRAPHITLSYGLARLFPHWLTAEQRIGNCAGGAPLPQLVLTSPKFVSWKDTVP